MSETIATTPTMLTGFAERRRDVLGASQRGAISIQQATEIIGWLPHEATVHGTYLTEEGVTTVTDKSRKMLVHPRTGAVLGVHGDGYKVHGYEETLLRDAAAITDGELSIAKVTVLGDGKRAAVQYEFDENVTTRHGIEFRPFLSAATSLDGSIATSFFTGSTVIICDNSLQLAIRRARAAGDLYRVRHTRNSQVDVGIARTVLDLVWQTSDEFAAEFDRLADQFVSDQKWNDILDRLVPKPKDDSTARSAGMAERKRAELSRLWNYDERVAPWKNSAYGVVAAVNTYANHVQSVKGGNRAERNVAKLIDGSFAKVDQLVLKTLETV